MRALWHEVASSVKRLAKRPGYAAAAILVLGLGIGANSATFSVVNAVLLRELPYNAADRLVMVDGNFLQLKLERIGASAPEFVEYRDQSTSFSELAAFGSAEYNVVDFDQPERVRGARVTASVFPLLRGTAMLGRLLTPADNEPGRDAVAVLSYGLWQRRYAGERDVLEKSITLDGRPYAIVGVMPPDFAFPHPSFPFAEPAELWTPLVFSEEQLLNRAPYNLRVIGRLAPEVSLDAARAEMAGLAARMEDAYPRSYRGPGGEDGGWRVTVTPLREAVIGNIAPTLWIVLGAVGFVLLIACANVASLVLTRAIARRGEFAVRVALGASPWQIARQLCTETVVIGIAGGGVGILFSLWINDLLVRFDPVDVPRVGEVSFDSRVMVFTLLISVLTGLVLGLAPALHASGSDPNETLKEFGSTSSAGAAARRLMSLLVVAEVAVSVVLLVGAGLMIRSFERLRAVDPGYDPSNIATMAVALPSLAYPEAGQRAQFFERLLARLSVAPGIESAGATTALPVAGRRMNGPVSVEGRPFDPTTSVPVANYRIVSASYFETMNIPLVVGDALTDTQGGAPSAVVNRAFVASFFPAAEPIGNRIKLGAPTAPRPWLTIIGVVGDVRNDGLDAEARPEIYVSYSQEPAAAMTLVVRSSAGVDRIVSTVRGELKAIDPHQPVHDVRTMESLLSDTVARRRFSMSVLAALAAVALLLTAVGLYGVVAYTTAQRSREFAIRLALGAQPRDVLRLAVGRGMTHALVGIALGILAALILTRLLETLLFGVSAADPATFAAVTGGLGLIALVACYIPARRALEADPAVTLRHG